MAIKKKGRGRPRIPRCPICNKKFKTEQGLGGHMFWKHQYRDYFYNANGTTTLKFHGGWPKKPKQFMRDQAEQTTLASYIFEDYGRKVTKVE